jgi:murein DD-endopeptidase MepM/ murein hydrolase activator NlpD
MSALSVFLAMAAALAGPVAAGDENCAVHFSSREEGERVVVSGANRHPGMPHNVEVDFPIRENMTPSRSLPARFVIPPASEMDLMWLDRIDPKRPTRIKVTYKCGIGDPGAISEKDYVYIFPYPHGTKCLVSQGYRGTFTHQDSYALDFQLPEGASVCAARPGVVVKIKQDSDIGGPGREYSKAANHIFVLHRDGTWACYSHLKRNSVLVNMGQVVDAGDILALSGATGQVSGPHLHFVVCKAQWGKDSEQSLPVKFNSLDGKAVSAEEGKFYYSVHPGQPAFEPVFGEQIRDEDLEVHNEPIPTDGRVRMRAEEIDHRVFLYCANGTDKNQHVTLDLAQLKNLAPSKPLPYARTVPAGREVFMLSLTGRFKPGRAEWDKSYEMRYSWIPAAAARRR